MSLLRYIALIIILLTAAESGAQSTFRLGHLNITGNERTRTSVFLREIGAEPGDTTRFADSMPAVWEKRIAALGLFNDVQMSRRGDTLDIQVKERIYTWALPELTWADRNFNVWWETRDPQRLIYGATVYFNNIRGLNHSLAITLIHGYNRSYSIQYTKPFSKHRNSWGYSVGAGYWSNHELWYKTVNDRVQFLNIEHTPVQRNHWIGGILRRRITYFSRLEWSLSRGGFNINDSARRQDPTPVNNYVYGLKRDYYEAGMTYVSDHRDQRHYPTSGYLIRGSAGYTTLNTSTRGPAMLNAELRSTWYQPLGHKLVFVSSLSSRYRQTVSGVLNAGDMPYYFSRQLGYGSDYVRGYEPYVAEGPGFILGKMGLRRALLNGYKWQAPGGKWLNNYRTVPLSLWLNIFADAGRIIRPLPSPDNELNIRWMNGAGLGLDVIAWYTAMARFEISRNHYGNWIFNISYTNAF